MRIICQEKMIKGSQIHVARILLGLTQEELSNLCGVGLSTLRKTEGDRTGSYGKIDTMQIIQTTLEKKGAEFVNFGGKTGVIVKDKFVSARNLRNKNNL
jgi:transcriptional regulator with XRE-family HTH domain